MSAYASAPAGPAFHHNTQSPGGGMGEAVGRGGPEGAGGAHKAPAAPISVSHQTHNSPMSRARLDIPPISLPAVDPALSTNQIYALGRGPMPGRSMPDTSSAGPGPPAPQPPIIESRGAIGISEISGSSVPGPGDRGDVVASDGGAGATKLASTGGDASTPSKANRLRKACDSCSIRKVKCDESGPPCRACAALELPCTFDRPSRRRGPPNRHAEAVKRRRLEEPSPVQSPPIGLSSDPSSPTYAAKTLASLSTPHQSLSAEAICSISTLRLLIDDYFTYMHPLVPVPHEPTFRAAFERREDRINPTFLSLLASMIACLVASFPRKPRQRLTTQREHWLYPNSASLVNQCRKVALEARGAGYLDRDLSVYDCAVSYFLGLSGAYMLNLRHCYLYFEECAAILRTTANFATLSGPDEFSAPTPPSAGAPRGGETRGISRSEETAEGNYHEVVYNGFRANHADFIVQELGRRLFWLMFVGLKTLRQLGLSFNEQALHPPTPTKPYPPLAVEVDDAHIFPTHIGHQPPGTISELVGFNYNVKIYLSDNQLSPFETAYGAGEVFDWSRQQALFHQCLRNVKSVLDSVPPELMLRPGKRPGEFENTHYTKYRSRGGPAGGPAPVANMGGRGGMFGSQQHAHSNGGSPTSYSVNHERRDIQYEVQKANIYVSWLSIRSYVVEKYFSVSDVQGGSGSGSGSQPSSSSMPPPPNEGRSPPPGVSPEMMTPPDGGFDLVRQEMAAERETIIKDLLLVIRSISQVNMEPNNGSLINKIRQVASTLLNAPRTRKGQLALKVEQDLKAILDLLVKLERAQPPAFTSTASSMGDAEENELRHWASLKEYQSRFLDIGFYSQ